MNPVGIALSVTLGFHPLKLPRQSMNVAMSGLALSKHQTILSPKKEIKEKMKTWPDGMSLALEAITSKGVKLINFSKILCFIATKNAGLTLPGDTYQVRFVDGF